MEMPGEKLLIKMWETLVEKGIGGLITPYYTPWKEKKLALGQIELNKAKILAEKKATQEIEALNSPQLLNHKSSETNIADTQSLQTVITNQHTSKLIREELNVSKAIHQASIRLLEEDKDIPKEEIDQDWLFAWREHASKVTNEEVQTLWGNVLAQEFIEPGRYSLRLLEFLKTMSKSEAMLIEKVAPFISQSGLIYTRTNNSLERPKHSFEQAFNFTNKMLKLLEELSIVTGIATQGMIATLNDISAFEDKEAIFIIELNHIYRLAITLPKTNLYQKNLQFKYSFYPTTTIGKEIFSLIKTDLNLNYIKWLSEQYTDDAKVMLLKKENDIYKKVVIGEL